MIVQKASWIQEQTPQRGYKKKKKKKKTSNSRNSRNSSNYQREQRQNPDNTEDSVSQLGEIGEIRDGEDGWRTFPWKVAYKPRKFAICETTKRVGEVVIYGAFRRPVHGTKEKGWSGLPPTYTQTHTHTHTHTHTCAYDEGETRVGRRWASVAQEKCDVAWPAASSQ